ncbi:hypothetical protein D9M68_625540 [compost metagenome]
MPAEVRNHRGGDKAAGRGAERKAAEHGVHQHGPAALRRELGGQRHGIGHGGAQTQAGQEAQHRQPAQRGRKGRGQAAGAKEEDRQHQHLLAADAVGQRAGKDRAEGEAEQGRAHDGPEGRFLDPPVLHQRRRDIPDGGGIETVDGNHQEAKHKDEPLVTSESLSVDQGLDVRDASLGLEGLGHCCLRLPWKSRGLPPKRALWGATILF